MCVYVQAVQAEQGHVPSMMGMADLHYWGARGVARDHTRALAYFEQACAHTRVCIMQCMNVRQCYPVAKRFSGM